MHLVFMTLEYFRIVALTFVQKILAGSVFNTKMGEKSKCKEKRSAWFSLVFPPSFLSLSFQRPRQTRAETLATQATPERKFIYTLSSADRLSEAFL